MVLACLPLAAPIGLSPLHILTLCGSECVLVVSTEPLDDLSCLTTPGSAAVARAVGGGWGGGGGGGLLSTAEAPSRSPHPPIHPPTQCEGPERGRPKQKHKSEIRHELQCVRSASEMSQSPRTSSSTQSHEAHRRDWGSPLVSSMPAHCRRACCRCRSETIPCSIEASSNGLRPAVHFVFRYQTYVCLISAGPA